MLTSEINITTSNQPRCYQIRERFFTFGNSFKIKDELGLDKYTVRSKKWTLQKKLVLAYRDGQVKSLDLTTKNADLPISGTNFDY